MAAPKRPRRKVLDFVQALADEGRTPQQIADEVQAAIGLTHPHHRQEGFGQRWWVIDRVCPTCGANVQPHQKYCMVTRGHRDKPILRREYLAGQQGRTSTSTSEREA